MKLSKTLTVFFGLVLLAGPHAAFAQSEDNHATDFASAELLIETFLRDDADAVNAAEANIAAAEEALAAAEPGSQELTDAQQALTDAETELEDAQLALNEETEQVHQLVSNLTDEQLFAFNRSLNNQRHNKFPVDLDAVLLQMAIDGDYTRIQINFLTKAYEEEAKFLSHADKFTLKAEESENDDFLAQAERMRDKAESSKAKFLARIDQHDGSHETPGINREDARETRSAARETAKDAARDAREAARDTARGAAKDAAKDAREAAREAAKEVAREAREAAREAAKSRGNN